MEGKHTPGKWGLNKYGGLGAGERFTERVIITSDGWAHDWTPAERERAEADKALIAAAPDLLEALQLIVDCDAFIPNLTRQTQDDIEHDAERRDMLLRKAAEAITRATGKP